MLPENVGEWQQQTVSFLKHYTSTPSSQHRLLNDLYERLNNLGPEIVRNHKERKKIKKLRGELAQQISLIKDGPSNAVPKRMQIVTDAIQMLFKYPTGSSSRVGIIDGNSLDEVKYSISQE